MKHLIVTADDFGLDPAVNEAVEAAHRDGILTGASLMVAAPAAVDAVARARRLPGLKLGLHIALVDAVPFLPAAEVPALTGADGEFSANQAAAGVSFFFRPAARRQLAREIRAQFAAFAATGLPLDHVNAHKHMHLHPTVAGLIVEIGREYGLTAVRLPAEPPDVIEKAAPGSGPGWGSRLLEPWIDLLKRRLRRAGLATNDHVFGIHWSGAMTEEKLLALLPHLPKGVSEIYSHPAAAKTAGLAARMPDYRPVEEFQALLSPTVKAAVRRHGIVPIAFGDLKPAPVQPVPFAAIPTP